VKLAKNANCESHRRVYRDEGSNDFNEARTGRDGGEHLSKCI